MKLVAESFVVAAPYRSFILSWQRIGEDERKSQEHKSPQREKVFQKLIRDRIKRIKNKSDLEAFADALYMKGYKDLGREARDILRDL